MKILSALVFLVSCCTSSSVAAATVSFFPPPDGAEGITVSVIASPNDAPDLLSFSNNRWTYELPADEKVWRAEPTFVITLPKRSVEPLFDGPMEVSLPLTIRMDKPQDVEIPIAIFDGIDDRSLDEVEEKNPRKYIEFIQVAQQLTRILMQDPRRKSRAARLAKAWFDNLHRASAIGQPVRIDDEVMGVVEALYDNMDYFHILRDEARSRFWQDQKVFEGLMAQSPPQCELVEAMLKDLERRNEANPGDAAIAKIEGLARLAAVQTAWAKACASGTGKSS